MEFYAFGVSSSIDEADRDEIGNRICNALKNFVPNAGNICIVPPDFSRNRSRAGEITAMLRQGFGKRISSVLPALGTHHPMTETEIRRMFPGVPPDLFHRHNFRNDAVTLGRMPAEYIEQLSEGRLSFDWPVQINRRLTAGFDCIVSIGQVVPHEITGMANYTKNILIGTGGKEAIDKSHYLAAVYGMERILGRTDTPVRRLLNSAAKRYLGRLPILYVLTVIEQEGSPNGRLAGIFIGDSPDCFRKAAALSRSVNLHATGTALQTCVVHLDPAKYTNFWIGNKSIYRLRMAMADGGKLWINAPGICRCGEDPAIDSVVRKYGYIGTETITGLVQREKDLRENLSAAAHLIHGSTEGRFSVIVSTELMDRKEIEALNYGYCSPADFAARFPRREFKPGWNTDSKGQSVFYVPDPALGLWTIQKN